MESFQRSFSPPSSEAFLDLHAIKQKQPVIAAIPKMPTKVKEAPSSALGVSGSSSS